MTDTTNTNTAHAAALAVRNAAAALARRRPLYDGASGEPADEDLAQAIEDLPLPDVDMTDWKAEAERLRAALDQSQQQTQEALDNWAAALADRRAELARAERYMAERNAARLEAQREVGEAMRKLRKEHDHASSLFDNIATKHARLAAWAREALPKELQDPFFAMLANGAPDWRTTPRNLAVDLLAMTAERDAALAELERVQARGWPSTPEDVRALLGSRCGAVRYALPVQGGAFEAPPHESDTYTVSAHDLITCNIAASELRYAADVELERVRAALDQARDVLREVEWVSDDIPYATPPDYHRCPDCWAERREGHAPDCALSAALTATGE